jgi:hypothetical protein
MVEISDLTSYLDPLMPVAAAVSKFLIPYFLIIGEFFMGVVLPLVELFPTDSHLVSYIVAALIAVVGAILGIKFDPDR